MLAQKQTCATPEASVVEIPVVPPQNDTAQPKLTTTLDRGIGLFKAARTMTSKQHWPLGVTDTTEGHVEIAASVTWGGIARTADVRELMRSNEKTRVTRNCEQGRGD